MTHRTPIATRVLIRLMFPTSPPLDPNVDYSARCPGCGYYDGEDEAGQDHHGWNCHFIDVGPRYLLKGQMDAVIWRALELGRWVRRVLDAMAA